jgi:hypothetical protein
LAQLRGSLRRLQLQERSCDHRSLMTEDLQAIHQRVSLLTALLS